MLKKSKIKQDQPLNPYSIDRLARIDPKWKIGFLKFWIVGASFYYSIFGLPQRFDFFDRMIMFGLVLVLMFQYIGFTFIYWMHTEEVNTKKYLPHEINRKSVWSILATGVYVLIMILLVNSFIDRVNYYGIPTFATITTQTNYDPITYGLVFLLFDYIWIKIRTMIQFVKQDSANSKKQD